MTLPPKSIQEHKILLSKEVNWKLAIALSERCSPSGSWRNFGLLSDFIRNDSKAETKPVELNRIVMSIQLVSLCLKTRPWYRDWNSNFQIFSFKIPQGSSLILFQCHVAKLVVSESKTILQSSLRLHFGFFFFRQQERKVYDEVFSFSQQAMINYMIQAEEKEEQKAFMDSVSLSHTQPNVRLWCQS